MKLLLLDRLSFSVKLDHEQIQMLCPGRTNPPAWIDGKHRIQSAHLPLMISASEGRPACEATSFSDRDQLLWCMDVWLSLIGEMTFHARSEKWVGGSRWLQRLNANCSSKTPAETRVAGMCQLSCHVVFGEGGGRERERKRERERERERLSKPWPRLSF